jgi:glycosyltransferase involved in cell wall biosynthesis
VYRLLFLHKIQANVWLLKNQTYKDIEIFVVDCSSSDATATIVSQELFYPRRRKNKSQNFGISNSHGKFLLFLDSDMNCTATRNYAQLR